MPSTSSSTKSSSLSTPNPSFTPFSYPSPPSSTSPPPPPQKGPHDDVDAPPSSSSSSSPPCSPLLRLPPELRSLIYAHLTPAATLSYPLGPNTAISALSHRPPPLALLLTSRTLAAEALDHFYRTACFRVMLNPPAPLADPHFQRLAALPQLRRVRNLGVLLDWDSPRAAQAAPPSGVVGGFDGGPLGLEEYGVEAEGEAEVPYFRSVMDRGKVADMLRLAKRVVGVLGGAGELRRVVVSWTDLVDGCWEGKRAVLEVLRRGLGERGVRVVRGHVVALDEVGVGRLFEGWEAERWGDRFWND